VLIACDIASFIFDLLVPICQYVLVGSIQTLKAAVDRVKAIDSEIAGCNTAWLVAYTAGRQHEARELSVEALDLDIERDGLLDGMTAAQRRYVAKYITKEEE